MPIPAPRRDATQENLLTIGVGLMNYYGWRGRAPNIYEAYIEKMGRFVSSLLARGYRVRLLTGETVDERAVTDVGRIASANGYQLIDGTLPAPEAGQLVAEPAHSLHDVMRQIGDTDIVIATRFHNVVCALKLARPTVSIGYEAKNDAVMTELGLGDFCQFIEDLDLDRLEMQFTKLQKEKQHYQGLIRRNLEAVQIRVKRHEQALLSAIL